MNISELITINPLLIRSNQTAIEVSRLFLEQNIDGAQVIDDEGKPLGFITHSHLLYLIAHQLSPHTLVRDLMTNNIKVIQAYHGMQELPSNNEIGGWDQQKPMALKSLVAKQFIVHSNCMRELTKMAIRIAKVDSTVLIQGESGVGKELIADVIHAHGMRHKGPLIKINCGAIPENLLESEFFGYDPGAFSGASRKGKIGLFEIIRQCTNWKQSSKLAAIR